MLEAITIGGAVTDAIGWIKDAMEIFMKPPAIYFVGLAVIGASAGVARRFVPMKKR